MNAQPQTAAPAPAKLPEPPAQRKLVALVLFEASRFNHSDTITAKSSAGVAAAETRIIPARVCDDGDWLPVKPGERPDGFGLEQLRGTGAGRKLHRGFVTWGAVKELVYAE